MSETRQEDLFREVGIPSPLAIPVVGKGKDNDSSSRKKNNRKNIYPHNECELPIQNWYSIVAGYSGPFVSEYILKWGLNKNNVIFDPFAGTGTTLLTAQFRRVGGLGVEANPFSQFATRVKINWSVDIGALLARYKHFRHLLQDDLANEPQFEWIEVPTTDIKTHLATIRERSVRFKDIDTKTGIPVPQMPHLDAWLSPRILDKVLHLKALISLSQASASDAAVDNFILLAFTSVLLPVSNMKMHGPKIAYRRKNKRRIICTDAPVYTLFLKKLLKMISDLELLPSKWLPGSIYLGDAKTLDAIPDLSIDASVTSPPYLNEVDYIDNSRLELYFMEFVKTENDLRALRERMIRANTKYLFKSNRDYPNNLPELPVFSDILNICHQIEKIWKDRKWGWDHPRLVAEYFTDMTSHFSNMYRVLKDGAPYLMVVGDSAINKILVPTDKILARIAKEVGFSKTQVIPFRDRSSSRHHLNLRESLISMVK